MWSTALQSELPPDEDIWNLWAGVKYNVMATKGHFTVKTLSVIVSDFKLLFKVCQDFAIIVIIENYCINFKNKECDFNVKNRRPLHHF